MQIPSTRCPFRVTRPWIPWSNTVRPEVAPKQTTGSPCCPDAPRVNSTVLVITRFNLNSTTTDTQRPWFPYAMQSSLIMRVTLSLAAEFLTATLPALDPKLQREGYHQKGEAMRIIRARLESRESARSASDDLSVLAGVAMLGSVEVGSPRASPTSLHY